MSRTVTPPVRRPATPYANVDIPEELKAERLTYSPTPNIKGMDAAAERICVLFGLYATDAEGEKKPQVKRSFIKFHTETTKKLAYHLIGGNRWYSDRDLFDLMHIGTRPDSDERVGA